MPFLYCSGISSRAGKTNLFPHGSKYGLLCSNLSVKGTLSRGFLRIGVKNVLKFKLKAFSLTQNTPRTSREGNQMIFSKEEQTIVSYWRFFYKTKEKLGNNQPDVFKLHTLDFCLRELVEVVLMETQPVFLDFR